MKMLNISTLAFGLILSVSGILFAELKVTEPKGVPIILVEEVCPIYLDLYRGGCHSDYILTLAIPKKNFSFDQIFLNTRNQKVELSTLLDRVLIEYLWDGKIYCEGIVYLDEDVVREAWISVDSYQKSKKVRLDEVEERYPDPEAVPWSPPKDWRGTTPGKKQEEDK